MSKGKNLGLIIGVILVLLVIGAVVYLSQPAQPLPTTTPTTPQTTTPSPTSPTAITPSPTPPPETVPSPTVTTPPPTSQPIVACIIYNPRVSVLKAMAEAFKLGIKEINERGGILGRQVVLLEEDHQGKADLAVAAYRRLVTEKGCKYVFIDGVSEIALAVMEAGATLYPSYKHVVIVPGQGAMATTLKVINDYDKYKFYFRPFFPDPDLNYVVTKPYFDIAKNVIGAKKVALFLEDAAWTLCSREGCTVDTKFGSYKFKPMREWVKEEFGLDVVYEVKIAVGEKNFVPYLEEAARRGAEFIFVLSSWYTDTTTLTKQWATSSARDIPLALFGGPNQWAVFWNITGGAALGVITLNYDVPDYPYIKARSLIPKAHALGLRVDSSVHMYYSTAYLLKIVIEKVGNPDDIENIIKTLEEVKFSEHTLYPPDSAYLGSKDYRFHSYIAVPGFVAQFQCGGKIVFISRPDYEGYKIYTPAEVDFSVLRPQDYKSPKVLRETCK
ncbi:ABC-type branched-chain amino acid transport systems, periplasmic component [Pyrobaculum oguniense TE7]|uniref:ABC-type branched-chain amino acid transport systems, periplasmic component n=1 Tax=Pyrobaculum oguniense (strain DSM 13380 / JCM 10595 / TE7) TaxID=698757 RepID=H6QDJ9_PYROT|nr:ABC-type branched-chain amino acid transport systems, periplasmic component [Pyrobaculum oguniense TE7]